MPYRTFEDRIDGLVITFFNITDLKQLEAKLHENEQMHRLILNSSSDLIIKLSTNLTILEFNREAEKFFGRKRKELIDLNFLKLFVPENQQIMIQQEFNKLLQEKTDTKYKIAVIAAEKEIGEVEWAVNILLNSLQTATEMIFIVRK